MFTVKSTIAAVFGAAGVALLLSSEIGAVLFGMVAIYAPGPIQIACNILFALMILCFFALYCLHAYRVERSLQLEDLS